MRVILFAVYYGKLRLGAMLGVHKISNPLAMGWRWNHWQDRYERQQRNR